MYANILTLHTDFFLILAKDEFFFQEQYEICLFVCLFVLWILCGYLGTIILPRCCSGKESACQCRRWRRHGFDPWVGKIS